MPDFLLQLSLPVETTTGRCFIQHYIESILALQEASSRQAQGLHMYLFFGNISTADYYFVREDLEFKVHFRVLRKDGNYCLKFETCSIRSLIEVLL